MPRLLDPTDRAMARVTLSEVRPNSGTPTTPAPLSWVLGQQSPFPWVYTVALLPLTDRQVPAGESV